MNIKELLASTATVKGYGGGKNSFASKPFGNIYFFNKTIKPKYAESVIEISMMIEAVTDKIKPSKNSPARPVAIHNVQVQLYGVKQELVTGEELVRRIRETNEKYKNEKEYPEYLLKRLALDHQNEESKSLFPGKTVMDAGNGTYSILTNKISDETEIRVWCSCSAYYWAFQYYNCENKVDIHGRKPDKYIPKTQKGYEAWKNNEPMRNPNRSPGCCKHILMLIALLMDSDVIEPSKGVSQSILSGYNLNVQRFTQTKMLRADVINKRIAEYKRDKRIKSSERNLRAKMSSMLGVPKGAWSKTNKWHPPTKGRGGYWSKG